MSYIEMDVGEILPMAQRCLELIPPHRNREIEQHIDAYLAKRWRITNFLFGVPSREEVRETVTSFGEHGTYIPSYIWAMSVSETLVGALKDVHLHKKVSVDMDDLDAISVALSNLEPKEES